ncbi:Protein DDI1 like protein 1 [Dictyocoela muelleri]|nr:Protein DDI1 like protein 1 [Dictyocoela muelleri]
MVQKGKSGKKGKINHLSNYILPYIIINSVNGYPLKILVDSGATSSFIKKTIAIQENFIIKDTEKIHIKTAMGHSNYTSGSVDCKLLLMDHNEEFNITFNVLEELEEELIIGSDFLRKYFTRINLKNAYIELNKNKIELNKRTSKVTLISDIVTNDAEKPPAHVITILFQNTLKM